MHIQRKIPLSLIEICVACALFSVALFILFGSFKNSARTSIDVARVKPKIIEQQILYQRCMEIFSTLDVQTIEKKKGEFSFTFENPLDSEMQYSGKVKGTIFVNDENLLLLKITSNTDKNKHRYELLRKDVKDAQFTTEHNTLLMKLFFKESGGESTLAFFLPKLDDKGLAVKVEKK